MRVCAQIRIRLKLLIAPSYHLGLCSGNMPSSSGPMIPPKKCAFVDSRMLKNKWFVYEMYCVFVYVISQNWY